jgi:hypothetical protein
MHLKFPRAAVAADTDRLGQQSSPPAKAGPSARTTVLWASRPLQVQAGRLLAVRKRGDVVEVGLVSAGAAALRWVSAATVLTDRQADGWVKTAKFSR